MKRIMKLIALLVALVILLATASYLYKVNAATTGVINAVTVNVRKKASIDSNIVATVTEDDKVEILEKTGDWYKIKYEATTGYVYADFITLDDHTTAKLEKENKVTTADDEATENIQETMDLSKNTGIKIAPVINSTIIYTTTQSEKAEILEQIGDWNYIEISSISIRGWIRNIEEEEKETTVAKEETKTIEKNEEKTETKSKDIMYVKYDSVNLRKEPSADSKVLEKMKKNTEVVIIKEVDNVWNKVTVNGKTGYVSKDLLTSKKSETTTSRDGQNVKREDKEKVQEEKKTQVKAVTEAKKKEETKNTISSNKSSKTSDTTTVSGEDVVAYAMKYLNYKYTYGGSSPKTGFDCSGFTSYVYKHFGYTLSRSSGGQASVGTKVEKKDLKPGDILVFKNRSLTKIGHVGIYIGNNKMIHASEPGVGVTITDIDSKAYKYPQRFVMGRRIIK